jgi:hypothetical protein
MFICVTAAHWLHRLAGNTFLLRKGVVWWRQKRLQAGGDMQLIKVLKMTAHNFLSSHF